jgi:hypothetical protein
MIGGKMPLILTQKLKAEDLFDGLTPENEQGEDRKIEVRKDERLEELARDFERILENKRLGRFGPGELSELDYQYHWICRSENIEKFSLILGRYQDLEHFSFVSGLFLSSLINHSDDNDFVLHTTHLTTYPGYIGYFNTKNITIKGNAGKFLGNKMSSGRLIVEGDADSLAGDKMTGGLIAIMGDANYCVGSQMKGGEIHINGDYGTISEFIFGGNIYHRGKQIFKAGEPVEGAKVKWAR